MHPERNHPDANIDVDRHLRTGLPEVVFAAHKTPTQTATILTEMYERQGFAFATRVGIEAAKAFASNPDAKYSALGETLALGSLPPTGRKLGAVCAGTSDLRVLEELTTTLEWLGHTVVKSVDVGVAGIHRIFAELDDLRGCEAVAVVAGMEGALPSVVSGLIRAPVIAVPTSVGYGVTHGGFAALFAMLGSCSPGIAVVNIDNGFGAAAFMHKLVTK